MDGDSAEKILADWNALNRRSFSKFDDLYRYLKRHSKQQGKPIKQVNSTFRFTLGRPKRPSMPSKALKNTRAKVMEATSEMLTFRLRVKKLIKSQKSI